MHGFWGQDVDMFWGGTFQSSTPSLGVLVVGKAAIEGVYMCVLGVGGHFIFLFSPHLCPSCQPSL